MWVTIVNSKKKRELSLHLKIKQFLSHAFLFTCNDSQIYMDHKFFQTSIVYSVDIFEFYTDISILHDYE